MTELPYCPIKRQQNFEFPSKDAQSYDNYLCGIKYEMSPLNQYVAYLFDFVFSGGS